VIYVTKAAQMVGERREGNVGSKLFIFPRLR
jgi:hypothetical protein